MAVDKNNALVFLVNNDTLDIWDVHEFAESSNASTSVLRDVFLANSQTAFIRSEGPTTSITSSNLINGVQGNSKEYLREGNICVSNQFGEYLQRVYRK